MQTFHHKKGAEGEAAYMDARAAARNDEGGKEKLPGDCGELLLWRRDNCTVSLLSSTIEMRVQSLRKRV